MVPTAVYCNALGTYQRYSDDCDPPVSPGCLPKQRTDAQLSPSHYRELRNSTKRQNVVKAIEIRSSHSIE